MSGHFLPRVSGWLALLLAALPLAAGAQAGVRSAAQPAPLALELSADGQEVLDPVARLSWRRCVEGMHWNGKTCEGQPLKLDRAQASERARIEARESGRPWRLPRATELRRLAGSARLQAGGVPVFPGAPADWHWTSSVSIDTSRPNPYNYGSVMREREGGGLNQVATTQGWAVQFGSGEARGDMARREPLAVRLVRGAGEGAPP